MEQVQGSASFLHIVRFDTDSDGRFSRERARWTGYAQQNPGRLWTKTLGIFPGKQFNCRHSLGHASNNLSFSFHFWCWQHPITRFLARYIYPNPQQVYEKNLHFLYEESECIALRKLEQKVKNHMQERRDYQAFYYRPITTKYLKVSKEATDHLNAVQGDN